VARFVDHDAVGAQRWCRQESVGLKIGGVGTQDNAMLHEDNFKDDCNVQKDFALQSTQNCSETLKSVENARPNTRSLFSPFSFSGHQVSSTGSFCHKMN
jgi:hypothetical protein